MRKPMKSRMVSACYSVLGNSGRCRAHPGGERGATGPADGRHEDRRTRAQFREARFPTQVSDVTEERASVVHFDGDPGDAGAESKPERLSDTARDEKNHVRQRDRNGQRVADRRSQRVRGSARRKSRQRVRMPATHQASNKRRARWELLDESRPRKAECRPGLRL